MNVMGESIEGQMTLKPFKTKKNISSAWSIDVSQLDQAIPISLSIKQKSESALLFRDFFVHLDLTKATFELPSAEVWV